MQLAEKHYNRSEMHVNQIYYRFKCETKEETMSFEEPEITAGDLKQKIRQTKFGNAPEKFELILKDSTNKRDYLDMEYIKPKTVVLVLRIPGHKSSNSGLCVQPTEEIVIRNKKIEESMEGEEKAKDKNEERWDSLLIKFNVRRGHRLYPFLKDARFFVIKSANEKNLETSQNNEEWATTTFNQDKLDKAYQSCANVIFFFSVNKSSHFQGMAKMVSGLTNRVSREWQTEGVRLGGVFKVKWIVTSKLSFNNISTLKTLTNEPIRKARDTTEIGAEAGIQIALQIDECRVPDKIDLPAAIAANPNVDINKLISPESDFAAEKIHKTEIVTNAFELFDDLEKKEEPIQEIIENKEEIKQIPGIDNKLPKEIPVVEEEKPAMKISDLGNMHQTNPIMMPRMSQPWNNMMPWMYPYQNPYQYYLGPQSNYGHSNSQRSERKSSKRNSQGRSSHHERRSKHHSRDRSRERSRSKRRDERKHSKKSKR